METDWGRFRLLCAEARRPVLKRFEKELLEGAEVSTVLSAPSVTGALTAALMTILRQMADLLEQSGAAASGGDIGGRGRNRVRQSVRRAYFTRLSRIGELEPAREYIRTHYRQLPRRAEEMERWLSAFRKNPDAAEDLVRKIDAETDAFIREEIPDIVL